MFNLNKENKEETNITQYLNLDCVICFENVLEGGGPVYI